MIKAPGNFLPSQGRGRGRAELEFTPARNLPLSSLPLDASPPQPSFPLLLGVPSSSSLGERGPNPKSSLCKVLPQDICAADSFCQLVTKLKTFHSSVIIFLALFRLASRYELCTVLLVLKKDPLSNLYGRDFTSDFDPPRLSCDARGRPGLQGARKCTHGDTCR